MNKKLILLPLMVFSFATTSCNSNKWNTIEETKVLEISKNIKDGAAKMLEEFNNNNSLKIVSTYTNYYLCNKVKNNFVTKITDLYDGNSMYGKSITESSDETHSGSFQSVTASYDILKDKHEYRLYTLNYKGTKSANEFTDDEFKSKFKEEAKESYLYYCSEYYVINEKMNEFLSSLKSEKETLESKKDGSYLNYHFESNGNNSLKFILEKKEMKPVPTNAETTINYKQRNVEITCSDNFINYIHIKDDERGTENGFDYTYILNSENNFSLNQTIEHDSINLKDYSIEDE